MNDKEKLVEIIQNSVGGCARHWAEVIADGLIAHGVTVQEWISASEPPRESGEYIVMILGGIIATTLLYSKPDNRWFESDDDEDSNSYIITHWMPMPRPPKGE